MSRVVSNRISGQMYPTEVDDTNAIRWQFDMRRDGV